MKLRKLVSLLLVLAMLSSLALTAFAADEIWKVNPTGYTKASDVKYVKVGNYIANWGVRGETATFLTSYAENYYTGSYTYATLSGKQGGTGQSNAPSSQLYKALKDMMNAKSTSTTSYNGTRDLYKYTDCMVSNYSYISSFYSGRKLNGAWDSGKTWNREHTWPNSKISGNGENDIMMLRPTSVKENSDRANKAYGESGSCYDPNKEATPNGFNVRGDCARIILYVYVRWGITDTMWGTSGVMESLDTLLKWMQEDPVDTWELGRNDAVQSITGVRNAFVDYPEFAWLLFGQKAPANYPTPSNGGAPAHEHNYVAVVTAPTCTEKGYTTYTCSICGDSYTADETAALNHNFVNGVCTRCDALDPDYKPEEPQPEPGNPFVDVDEEKDWFAAAVLWAVEQNITSGTTPTTFSPAKNCTRAEIVTFLYNASGRPGISVNAVNPFLDVKAGDWYYDAVLWAVSNQITNGTDTTHFSPIKKCSRAEVVQFLWNASKASQVRLGDNELPIIPIDGGDSLNFTDVSKNDWFYSAVEWAVANGITSGTTPTTFSPSKTCTRAEVVQFLYKAS